LNEVLGDKLKERLAEAEKKKFDELHKTLLIDDGIADLL
jgi:hypothetical protein